MYKIAIVDDEPLMLEGFRMAIDWAAHGYELIGTFQSPDSILEFCAEKHPNVLILDITMPHTDGITVLKQVKASFPEIIVIMLTAHNDFSYVRDSLRYHADEYLWKPEINFENILESINSLIDKQKEDHSKNEPGIIEFTDYKKSAFPFPNAVLADELRELEKAINIENTVNIQNSLKSINNIITNYSISKKDILSTYLHINHMYESHYSGINFDFRTQEKELLDIFYRKNNYKSFCNDILLSFCNLNNKLTEQRSYITNEIKRTLEEYINSNLSKQDLNLLDVSQAAGLSYSYCSRMFKTLTGKTFSKYLIDARMEKACEYLKYSNFKIDYILEAVGYVDKSYFIKSFRQYTSLTPARYRQYYKED